MWQRLNSFDTVFFINFSRQEHQIDLARVSFFLYSPFNEIAVFSDPLTMYIFRKKNFLDDEKAEIETDEETEIVKKKSRKPDQSDTKPKEKNGI